MPGGEIVILVVEHLYYVTISEVALVSANSP
jgi:hypothetical protein